MFPAIQKSYKGAAVGDFDGDGDSDVAVGLSASAQVQIYINDGGGIFINGALLSVSSSPGDLHVVDINSDGILDLVIGHDVGTNVTIVLGQGNNGIGNATFAPPATHQVSSSSSVQTLYIGQFNADSKLDIAVGFANLNKISISIGNGDGTFQASQDVGFSIQGPQQLEGGDFDTDGDLDLVATTSAGGVIVLINDGSGNFIYGSTISCGSPSNLMTDLKVFDFNADNESDVVALNGTSGNICLSAGNPWLLDATFSSPVSISTATGTPQRLLVRDFNGDLEPDLLVGSSNGRLQIFTGQTTVPEFVASADSIMVGGTTVTSMSFADLDGNSSQDDLVVATDSSANLNGLAVLRSVTGPDFIPPGSYRTGTDPVDIVTEDLNGDKLNDIINLSSG